MSVGSITSANCDCGVRFIEMENVRRRHLSQRRAHTFGMGNIYQNSKSKTIRFSFPLVPIVWQRCSYLILLTKIHDSLQGKGSADLSIALKLFHTEASLKDEICKPSPSSCAAHVLLQHLNPPKRKKKRDLLFHIYIFSVQSGLQYITDIVLGVFGATVSRSHFHLGQGNISNTRYFLQQHKNLGKENICLQSQTVVMSEDKHTNEIIFTSTKSCILTGLASTV